MRASEDQIEHAPFEPSALTHHLAQLQSVGTLLKPDAYEKGFYTLSYPVFPAALPEVPEAVGLVIASGDKVPCDGIWEPVAVERSKLLGMVPLGSRSLRGSGCFNYFIRDIQAPSLRDHEANAIAPTHWQLLWEDTRYADSVIPDESQYFLEPALASLFDDATVELVRTGDICPVTGEWETDEYGGKSIHVSTGATMPDMLVRDNLGEIKVHWVTWRLVRRA